MPLEPIIWLLLGVVQPSAFWQAPADGWGLGAWQCLNSVWHFLVMVVLLAGFATFFDRVGISVPSSQVFCLCHSCFQLKTYYEEGENVVQARTSITDHHRHQGSSVPRLLWFTGKNGSLPQIPADSWVHSSMKPLYIAAVAVFCPRHLSYVLPHCSLSFCPSSL